MSETSRPTTERPVVAGLAALIGVSLAVAILLGLAAAFGADAMGFGDDGEPASGAETGGGGGDTLSIPPFTETPTETGPRVTLSPDPQPKQPKRTQQTEEAESQISLVAGQAAVGQMEPIDLSGTYTGADGAILQVQQFSNGGWDDFPVTASVTSGSFSTYIQTSQLGENRFRMLDTDTGEFSNEVTVRIG